MYKLLKHAKSLTGRLVALSLVFLLGLGGVIGDGSLSVQAAEETFNVDIVVWSEDGTSVDSTVSNVTFSNSTLTVTPTSLTLKTDYSGRPLTVLQESGEYVDTSTDGSYTFSLNSVDEKIKVSFKASAELKRQISFTADADTMAKINAVYGQAEEDDNDDSGNGTYTIPTISTTVDGEAYDNAKHAEEAIVVISDEGIKAYITSLVINTEEYGGTLTFDADSSLYYTSEAGYNQYELSLSSLDQVISITYGPSGRYTYYVSFDSLNLTKYTGNITDVVPNETEEEEVPEINATHTINVKLLLDESGAEHTLNSTLNPVAQVEMGDEINVYVSISGREFQFQNADGTYSNNIISTVDGVRTYKITVTDLSATIPAQFATGASGFVGGCHLSFDVSSLTAIGDDNNNNGDDENNNNGDDENNNDDTEEEPGTGVATFTIGAEFQNEDGSVNDARNEYLNQEATLKVSYQSLVVYVSASERELFFDPDNDGEYDNVIESYEDGIRTYKFELSDVSKLNERIKTTFNVSGSNPNYDSSMPIVYLAFSVDADSLAKIQDIFDNGIAEDVDYTEDPVDDGSDDDGSGSDSSGTTSTGSGSSTTASSTKTGDTSSTGTLFILLLLSGVVMFCVNLRKKAI